MTVLRAEVRILADDGELVAKTITVDTEQREQPWMNFMADIVSVAKQAHVRMHPGFGEASPKRGKKAEKPWTQMELSGEVSA